MPLPPSGVATVIGLMVGLVIGHGAPRALAEPLVVDGGSLGGKCSDSRAPAKVTAAAPWCTIAQAVKAAPSGSTVFVRAGSYPHQDLNGLGSRTDYVTFEPFGYDTKSPEAVTIAGISTQDTRFLRFQGFHLVGNDSSGFGPAARIYTGSQYIQFIHNELTGQGIFLQTAAHVLLQGNYIHSVTRNCQVKNVGDGGGIFLIGANSKMLLSQDIQVIDNRVAGTLQDSLNVGSISNLVVRGNDMSTSNRPQCGDHTDLVQIEGGAMGPVTITNNTFHDGGQFILRNATGLTIENNLILRVNQWMQLVADPGARIVNNTWSGGNRICTGCGSLLIRDYKPGDSFTRPPFNYRNHMSGTVIENNITRLLANDGVPNADYHEDYNIVADRKNSTGVRGKHTIVATPSFLGPSNFRLMPRSPGIDSGDSNVAPSTDFYGHRRADDLFVRNTGIGRVAFADRGAVELTAPATPSGKRPMSLSVHAAFGRRAIGRGVFTVRVRCGAPCRIAGQGKVSFRHGRGSVPLASGTTRSGGGRGRLLSLRVTGSAGRGAISKRGGERATVTVQVQGLDGANRLAAKTVRFHLTI